ncbi:MAG: alpha/beta hydrolase family protein [Candidatus Hermodarchaeota archaeon]
MKNLHIENIEIPIKTDNIKLKGSIYFYSKTQLKAPWVIILAGFLAHRGIDFEKYFIKRFADEGFYVLSYDYRGHGENVKISNKFDLYKMTPNIFSDIHDVISWVLETQYNRISKENIILFGRSYGGAIVLTHGFIDKRVKYLIALCARYDYATVQIKIPDALKVGMSKDISPKYFLTKTPLNNERILIAHCKDDNRIPYENVLEIKKKLGLKDENVIIYENGGHLFEDHKDDLFNHIKEFLKKI